MNRTDQWRAATANYENQEDPRFALEEREEIVAELAREYRDDEAQLREAESWVAGSFDGDHYTAVTLALHELHHTNAADLLGSDLLARLYALAKVEALAIDERLEVQAREYLESAREDQP
jgi:hypothetical protein